MRFETSQSTPAFLDRRLQLRMLSFVGLIAVIMFTLGAMNLRPRDDSQRLAGASPDTLTFEVRREERDLKEGEFIIPGPEDNGPRGQSPRSNSSRERDLFTSRNKERSRTDSSDESLFRRRNAAAKTNDISPMERATSSFDSQSIDEDLTVPSRPAKSLDRLPPTGTPLADEEWGNEPVVRNEPPISNEFDTKRGSQNESFDLDEETRGVNNDLEAERRIPAAKPARRVDKTLDAVPDDLDPPIDLRRHRENSRLPAYDNDQAYGDVAPVRIDKRFLDVVKDNTVGIRRDEAEVFYWLLDHARRVPTAILERAGEREVQYINLMTEPDRFRGEPITIEGDLWRLYEFEAGKNQYGVTRIYEGWVFTGDSSNHPYRVVCTSLPVGIEPGEDLRKPVRITGYFFKREGYRSNGGVHVAPTLLARRISINPLPNGIPLTSGILPYMIGAIMAIGLALLVTIVSFAISDGRSSRENMDRLRKLPSSTLVGLHVPPTESVEETLRKLAESERESPVNGAYGPLFSRREAREHAVHDYATSQQLMADLNQSRHRHQTETLQSWATRQQAAQAEIDALRAKQSTLSGLTESAEDELDHDDFGTVRNLSGKPKGSVQSLTRPAKPAKMTHDLPPVQKLPAEKQSSPPKVETQQAKPTNISYSASKLSEWEDEVASITGRSTESRISDSVEAKQSIPAASSEPEQRPNPTSELNPFQIRIDSEHGQQGTTTQDESVRGSGDEERVAFDRADRDSKSFSLADSTSPIDESNESDDIQDEKPASRWGRFKKRRNR